MNLVYECDVKDLKTEKCDIIVQAGQSNAIGRGRGEGPEYVPTPKAMFVWPEFTTEVIEGRGIVATFTGKVTVSDNAEVLENNTTRLGNIATGYAREYAEKHLAPGRKLLVLMTAVGGTGFALKQWGVDAPLYHKTTELTDWALSLNKANKVVALLWHQGEHDAWENAEWGEEKRKNEYVKQLVALVSDFRKRYGDVPFISGDFTPRWRAEFPAGCRAIAQAFVESCALLGKAEFIHTDDLTDNSTVLGTDDDTAHFCRKSIVTLGERYLAALEKYI